MAYPRRERVAPETLAAWRARQAELREKVAVAPLDPLPRVVAGVDCAFDGDTAYAVAVAYDREAGETVQVRGVGRPVGGPYVPGYLSFREGPAVHAALDALTTPYGAILCDGQGLAHPRRCGLACHVGVERDSPAVGCAKSRLVGVHDDPGDAVGDAANLADKGERIGLVLRTRPGVEPLFISVGHRCDLDTAAALVLACRGRFRLPEPTRQADRLVARLKRGERIDLG